MLRVKTTYCSGTLSQIALPLTDSLIPDPDTDPDPAFKENSDPFRIQGFDDQKLRRNKYS
jgi:hypothetical protein